MAHGGASLWGAPITECNGALGSEPVKVVESYAALARSRTPEHLAGVALRTKSAAARDVFAHLASGGEYDYQQIIAALTADGAPPPGTLAEDRRGWLAALARVIAAQQLSDDDSANALAILDAVAETAGPDVLDPDQQVCYAQLLYLVGHHDRADARLPGLHRLRPVIAEYLRMDLANPHVRPGQDEVAWLKLLNGGFDRAGVERVHLLPDGPTPFDRLAATPRTTVDDGPLVSVVMSAYRPDEHLFSAVRSILEQTWRTLELIVVDDASGPQFDDTFAAVAALDPRVRVIRQETNGGTYLVRNAGIDAARGEFVTFQDSDDWSHPRRVELQVQALLADPERIGTRSLAIRAMDDLNHQWLGYPAQRVNASSLMFRVSQARARVGHFDSVRKSADFEFALRLEAAFGRKITDLPAPLAYTRLRMASLSRSDFTLGWSAPSRIAYQAAYQHWHRAIADGADPFLPRELTARPFPAPNSYLRGITPAPETRTHYDVVLVDDWVSPLDGADGGVELLDILARSGLSVGILHAESMARMSLKRRHVDHLVQDRINAGVADRITTEEDVSASLVIVLDPAVLQFAAPARAALRARQVVITTPRQPSEYPALELAYDQQTCTGNARTIFGVQPSWTRELTTTAVDVDRWSTPRTRRRSTRPVIGQFAPNDFCWPDSDDDLLRVYPEFGDVDVRLLGDQAATARVRRHQAKSEHLIYHRDQIGLRAFLNQLDFFVCFPGSAVTVAPMYPIAAALASGTVLILPERFEPLFGPAALYCSAAGVVPTVREYYAADARYAKQVEAGRRYVRENHSAEEYATQVRKLVAEAN